MTQPSGAEGVRLGLPTMPSGPRVLLCTEGTYPFVMGGVSTWCDLLLTGLQDISWEIFALTAGSVELPQFELPPNARLSQHVHLWGPVPTHVKGHLGSGRHRLPGLAANLVEGLLGWASDPYSVIQTLAWCRSHPQSVTPTFRDAATWDQYLKALSGLLDERNDDTGFTPALDLRTAIDLYQTMLWIARAASVPTPRTDVSLVTAAGWAALPAVVDKAIHGVPLVLAEHGIYVRESYLAAVRSSDPAANRFISTRMARGLTRMTYAAADVVAPVAAANAAWEEALGVPRERILTIPNGVPSPATPQAPPRTKTVVSVGRLDPLKDIQTLLRVSAAVLQRVPDAQVLHYGPVPRGQEAYAESCYRLHEELGLGDGFRFMGATSDPTGVMREADVVLMTSISEGFPMSVLEALSQARPVVTTLVGGVLDAMQGAGVTAPPGDVFGLADGVTTLLEDADLSEQLGRRGHARVSRLFARSRCLTSYDALLRAVAAPVAVSAVSTTAPPLRAAPQMVAKPMVTATARPRIPHGVAARASLTRLGQLRPGPRRPVRPKVPHGVAARASLTRLGRLRPGPRRPVPATMRPQRAKRAARVLIAAVIVVLAGISGHSVLEGLRRSAPALTAAEARNSATASGRGAATAVSQISFAPDLSVRAEQQVSMDAPVRRVRLSIPSTDNLAGGIFRPELKGIRIVLADGTRMPVSAALLKGASLDVYLPRMVRQFDVRYRAADAVVLTEPSAAGRAVALVTPLRVMTSSAMTSKVNIVGSDVLNIGCMRPDGSARACGRKVATGWTVTQRPARRHIAVVAQLNLKQPT